jgi:glutaredoxin
MAIFPLFVPLVLLYVGGQQTSNQQSRERCSAAVGGSQHRQCGASTNYCSSTRKGSRGVVHLAIKINGNEGDAHATPPMTATTRVIRLVLDQLKDSSFIEEKHQEHVQNPGVTHLFKGTPLAAMSEELRLQFVESWAGTALAAIMQEEQDYLGDWKIQKILEAAGTAYDVGEIKWEIDSTIASHVIVVYSFIDCPWCLATKALLQDYEYNSMGSNSNAVLTVELESLGAKGKAVRAELAKRTGRTSMPCIFVNGQPIGGYTDGSPIGAGLKVLHETGELRKMMMLDNNAQA